MDFLLEIGVEEIPDWMIPPALDHLQAAFGKLLADNRLAGSVDWADATPRRLVLRASGLPRAQTSVVETLTGPPVSAGAGAADGFARKLGVTAAELRTVTTPKGDYYGFRRKAPGRATQAILAEALPALILSIPWPKTMYWTDKNSARFIRPIRWLVALLGSKPVRFEVAGVAASNSTAGHRRFGKPRIKVTIASYEQKLRDNHVIVRAQARRQAIETGIAGMGLRVKPDPALLETLTYLTEWPVPIAGEFDPGYLSLPEEVLVTVMRHHQKYFSVLREDARLEPRFVAVMNLPDDPDGLVRSGNERVLRARFNDARFFWDSDQKRPLAGRVESLAHVTYHARLGSYLDKTQRVIGLVRELGGDAHAERAALLAKCDLTTDMVKEFTDLQGVVGGLYARAQGEPAQVAEAIYDHYRPLSMDDAIPRSEPGRILSLADKLDTLRECFRIGMIPTGSKDPFALRRAAQAAVRILAEGRLPLPLAALLGGDTRLEEFFADRVRYYFREVRGYPYDEVNAVMATGLGVLSDAADRLEALHEVRPTENFEPLAASCKRIRNILEQAGFAGGALDPAALEDGPERALYEAAAALELGRGYRHDLERMASLRPAVDLFFDKVLVNAPDEAVRRNRLSLLDSILTRFRSIADFSEIVTS